MICDLAETYHVLEYRELPPTKVAILVSGLPDSSRVKRKIANRKLTTEQLLLAGLVDRVSLLLWLRTEDGARGINKPKMVLKALEGQEEPSVYQHFDSVEEFERKRAELFGV